VIVALLLLVLPAGWSLRWLLLPLMVPLVFAAPVGRRPGELMVTVLDVGQGLAVVVLQDNHALLYDTGAGDPEGPNMATSVVLPYLEYSGISRLDALVISHNDNDHASGVKALAQWGAVDELWYGQSQQPVALVQRPCLSGAHYRLGELDVEVLHPVAGSSGSANSRSCVLMIRYANFTLLLPGDIGVAVEQQLVRKYGEQLRATVLLAPHHGSKTSSSAALLGAVRPRIAIFSAGYLNRFGHPAAAVERRYAARGVELFETAISGAITLRVRNGRTSVELWREQRGFYWH
jgi:competence protein ComEC